jgi:hypothetical protein
MFGWFKKIFTSKEFGEYSKSEKVINNNTTTTPKTNNPNPITNTTPTTPQTTLPQTITPPSIWGPQGQTGLMGVSGSQGQTGFTGSSSYIGNGYQVCTEEGCYSFFKVNNKNEKRCPTCVQKIREEKIEKLLE